MENKQNVKLRATLNHKFLIFAFFGSRGTLYKNCGRQEQKHVNLFHASFLFYLFLDHKKVIVGQLYRAGGRDTASQQLSAFAL